MTPPRPWEMPEAEWRALVGRVLVSNKRTWNGANERRHALEQAGFFVGDGQAQGIGREGGQDIERQPRANTAHAEQQPEML